MHRFFCIPTLVLASAMAVSAKDPPERPEPFPVVQAANPAAAPSNATAPPATPQTVRLQFPNSDVVDVLRLYEQLTGKKLVMDNFVQGKVNIFIAKDVSRDEAIKIIEMSMAPERNLSGSCRPRHCRSGRSRAKPAQGSGTDCF